MGRRRWVRGGIIGKGSYGTVSLAVDGSDGRIFAVKSVELNWAPAAAAAAAALENEIELLRGVRSAHIAAYLGDDVTEEGGRRFRNLHLEFVPGGTAAAAAGRMGEWEIRGCARSVAAALGYLHGSAGMVHGDVKGRNVLLGRTPGEAKLADFGCARKAEAGARLGGVGTPMWMAPEVARGGSPTAAADVWSLGCTVVEMAGGAVWGSAEAAQLIFRVGCGEDSPEIPPWISAEGRDFLEKCLRRDPADRWSCSELLRHSFLADWARESPRGILDWRRTEVESEQDEGEEEERESEDFGREMARERIRDLGSSPAAVATAEDWEDEGWVEVRSSLSSSAAAAEDKKRRVGLTDHRHFFLGFRRVGLIWGILCDFLFSSLLFRVFSLPVSTIFSQFCGEIERTKWI